MRDFDPFTTFIGVAKTIGTNNGTGLDQAVIAIMLISMGVIAGSMLTGMVMGATAAWQYGRMKAGKHPKFAAHALYWWFPSGLFLKLRATPPSDQRYFLG